MIRALAASDRAHEMREQTERWIRAELIPPANAAAARALMSDDEPGAKHSVRPSRVFQVMGAVFSAIGIGAATSLYFLIFSGGGLRPLLFIGLALLAATEWRARAQRHAAGGFELAASFLGVALFLAGMIQLLEDVGAWRGDSLVRPLLALGALLWAAAAWRWGHWLLGALACAFFFFFLGQFPYARVSWLVLASALVVLFSRMSHVAPDAKLPTLTPSERRTALAALVVAIGALYLSVQWTGYRYALIERFSRGGDPMPFLPWFRPISIAGTVLVPLALLASGIRWRRRVLLNAGTLLAAVSIATLHWHLPTIAHWAILILGGGVFLAVGLSLRRWFDHAPDRERGGFTADPIFEDAEESSRLETAASLGTMSPQAKPTTSDGPRFEGGGGKAGGGGASGSW